MQAFKTAKRRKSPAPRRLRLPRTDDTVPYCASLPVLIRRRINGGYPVAERNQDARALGNDERRLSRRLGRRAVKRLALRARAREDLLLRSGWQESQSDHSHYTGGRGVLDGVRRWASCAHWSNMLIQLVARARPLRRNDCCGGATTGVPRPHFDMPSTRRLTRASAASLRYVRNRWFRMEDQMSELNSLTIVGSASRADETAGGGAPHAPKAFDRGRFLRAIEITAPDIGSREGMRGTRFGSAWGVTALWRRTCTHRCQFRSERGRAVLDYRPQRRRQDLDRQLHLGPLPADPRPVVLSRARYYRAQSERPAFARHRSHLPEPRAVSSHERARQHHGRAASSSEKQFHHRSVVLADRREGRRTRASPQSGGDHRLP